MARPLRIQYENAYYHVTCRGNARQEIFANDQDRSAFLGLLNRSREIYQVEILAYVLMKNHFHLVVKTPLGNLKEFMRHFNISYTSYFNRRHGRVGHLYQGRYKAFLIDVDSYLQEVTRYLHLNPIQVKRKGEMDAKERKRYLERYPWSSYPYPRTEMKKDRQWNSLRKKEGDYVERMPERKTGASCPPERLTFYTLP